MNVKYYPISEDAAKRAKNANGFSDYVPGSATKSYQVMVDEAAIIAAKQKDKVDPMYRDKIESLLDKYARKLAEVINQRNEIDARVPSILVAGGSNFPVRKKEKQNAARERNEARYAEVQGILWKIRSTGLSEEVRIRLESGMSRSVHDAPYPGWALSNNNANIHRIRDRITGLEKKAQRAAENADAAPVEGDGYKLVENAELGRIQFLFDGKPDEATRTLLKANGFRWSPSQGAWQRMLNDHGRNAAQRVRDELDAIPQF